MLAVQVCCARHCELPLSKMGNKGLFPGVAVPRAFFGTFFRFERKYCLPRGGSPTVRAGVGASNPHRQKRACTCGRTKGLSSGQTIGAVRTAVRSACCLPELRVANRLRRLCPPGTRFPSFPPAPLRTVVGEKTHKGFPRGKQSARPSLPRIPPTLPQTTGPRPLPPSHCLFPFPERRPPYVHSL